MAFLHQPKASAQPSTTEGVANRGEGAADTPELDTGFLPFVHENHRFGPLVVKRLVDVVTAALAASIALPIGVVCAFLIRRDSRGPVLFRQERVGSKPIRIGGRVRWQRTTFTIYKFRTMVVDADQSIHRTAVEAYAAGEAALGVEADAPYKLTNDPRITRVGRWLRRTSLDELPQLINVLKGEMSLVGPRPLPAYEVSLYRPWHHERLCAKPGVTGLWQVEGRGRTSFDEGTALDISYVRGWNLLLDLEILMRTIPAVFSRRGAG